MASDAANERSGARTLALVRFVLARILIGSATLLVVCILVFIAVHLIPGGYEQILLGPLASDAARERVIAEYGLDRPLVVQFIEWFRHLLGGDLGTSMSSRTPVGEIIARRLPVTAELAALALAITLLIGIPLSVIAGTSRSWLARGTSRLFGSIAISVPDFVIGSVLVFVFSSASLWLKVGGYTPFLEDPIGNLQTMLLPAITLSVFGIAVLVRTGRDAVAATFVSPHVFAAIARGESRRHLIRHHVLRNSSIPMVTVLATYVGYLLGGAVVVESLFSLPGLGQAVLTALRSRDYGVVQGVVLISAALFILLNTLADILYGVIDPRTRTVER